MKHKFDILFLPLHRDIADVIASEVYWALNTFGLISKTFRTKAYVGRLSEKGFEHLGKLSDRVCSYGIDSNRSVRNDFLFYVSIFMTGIKNILSTKIWHHYGSFGYMKGFNPAFLLPKFGKKYILGPILFPTNDPPDTAVKLGFIKNQHTYGRLAGSLFALLHMLTLLRSDVIIFDCYDTRKIYMDRFQFLKRKNIQIIPGGGISDKDFYIDRYISERGDIIFGVASNLIKRKNVDKLIEAIALNNLDVNLKIAGDGPERENLVSMVKKLDLNNKVTFLGRIDHSTIRNFYNSIDVYIALDDVPTEAKISVQEAMMCGCAVISGESNVGNMALKKDWGYIVNPNACNEIKEAITSLCKDTQILLNMKNNATRYAKEKFSSSVISKSFRDIMDEII